MIYLQVDPAVSQKLMTQRYHGDETKKDVHEKDVEYLNRSRKAAEFCAAHLGWCSVRCDAGGQMRSIEEIEGGSSAACPFCPLNNECVRRNPISCTV